MVGLWLAWQVIRPYVAVRDFLSRHRHVHAGDLHPVDQEFVDLVEAESGEDDWALLEAGLTRSASEPDSPRGSVQERS
jgi:hypothetical protein